LDTPGFLSRTGQLVKSGVLNLPAAGQPSLMFATLAAAMVSDILSLLFGMPAAMSALLP
jgi:hypothetical protein